MNLATGIQKSINYIEEHITDELDLADIAKQAACSPYYFQKIFGILCDITVGEYIRNRRLTLAGSELKKPNVKVIDTALKYGYESPESFTRAFTRFHGITPTEAKRAGSKLRSFSRFKVQIILKGGNSMNYNIVKKDAFTVLEKVEQHSSVNEQNLNSVPRFWSRAHSDGTIPTLLKNSADNTYIFGICYDQGQQNAETFDYGISVVCAPDTVAPEGFRVNTIPARTWVVAECTGPMPYAIQQLWRELCTEFFPTSDYTPTYEMAIEAYPDGNMSSPDYKSQIWIPIVGEE